MTQATADKTFAIVPAAGIGSRMGADCPKQYLSLHGKTILEHTLCKLLQIKAIEKIVVAVSEQDQHWQSLSVFNDPRIETVMGGAERSDSVYAGLQSLMEEARPADWVLVHDVARPCVRKKDIEQLMTRLADDEVGGILAVPVSDTVKRVDGVLIEATVDRSTLWQAQTPQLFRYRLLHEALGNAVSEGISITDEASAIEWSGAVAKVVEGSRDNIKVTCPEDLALAEFFLNA
jgi:2-C-methyl-D-erythritol 4-phosphate cytidylyltransferase